MRLSYKLSLVMTAMIFLIIFVGLFSIKQLSELNQITNELALEWLPKTRLFGRINTLTSDFRRFELTLIMNVNPNRQTEYLNGLDKLQRQIKETESQLSKLIADSEYKAMFNDIVRTWSDYINIHQRIRAMLNVPDKHEELLTTLHGTSREMIDRIGSLIVQLNDSNTQEASKIADHTDKSYQDSLFLIYTMIAVSALIAAVILLFIVKNVAAILGKDPSELNNIANRVVDGDYNIYDDSAKIGVYGKIIQMVDALKININNAKLESERAYDESLKAQSATQKAEEATKRAELAKKEGMLTAANQLENITEVISSASTELSAQIEQSERGSAEQAARIIETATAMEEMNSTVLEVAKNAGLVSELSVAMRGKASQGTDLIQNVIQSINKVQRESISLKADMVILEEQAKSISQIMNVISDIADQTNLLALNAAIEAARAGDAGRGFAVVADEVRKLAEKTMLSTANVGDAIKNIQQSTTKSMNQVDVTVKEIDITTGLISQSGTSLHEILTMSETTADQIHGIATAAEQQSSTSEEINNSISHVNTIAAETSKAMQESARAVSQLAHQASILNNMIADMKNA